MKLDWAVIMDDEFVVYLWSCQGCRWKFFYFLVSSFCEGFGGGGVRWGLSAGERMSFSWCLFVFRN